MNNKKLFVAFAIISAAFNGQPTCAVETTLINNRNNNRKHIDDFHAIEEKFNEKFDPKSYTPKIEYLTLHHGMRKDIEGFVKAGGSMEIEKKFSDQIHDAIGGLEKLHGNISEYIGENPKKTIPYNELTSPDILMEDMYVRATEMLGCAKLEISRLTELKDSWKKACEMARQRKLSKNPKIMKLFTND